MPSHVPVREPHPAADTAVGDGRHGATANLPERPITDTGVNNLDDVDDVNPTLTPLGLAGRAAAFRTVQPLNLGPMNILYDDYDTRY